MLPDASRMFAAMLSHKRVFELGGDPDALQSSAAGWRWRGYLPAPLPPPPGPAVGPEGKEGLLVASGAPIRKQSPAAVSAQGRRLQSPSGGSLHDPPAGTVSGP